LADELNYKEKQFRTTSSHSESNYDYQKTKDDYNRLSREIMVLRDELNKYKLKLSHAYKDIDSYKTSLDSYEKHCNKLKHLNEELNRSLEEERTVNQKGRHKVQDQMMRISHKVNELEGYSNGLQSSNRDYHKINDNLMQCLLGLKEYVIPNDIHTSRSSAPGSVRSNLSGMFNSCSRNPLEMHSTEDTVQSIIKEVKMKFDEMKGNIFNYQNAINKLQGEKQQMYNSMNQLKFEKSQEFSTPVTKAHTSKKTSKKDYSQSKESDKSEAMIEYLRAEISHLRNKNRVLENEFDVLKSKSEHELANNRNLVDFMGEIFRPGKDLIYQLCSDPHVSESYFYKEDPKFHGIESKYCLDVCKIFDIATERIVDLRTVLDQKQQIISELDKKIIELRVKFNQQEQINEKQQQSVNRELEMNFEALDQK
jgi:chromosome segregation ATPase